MISPRRATVFSCSICDKHYSKKEHLQRHERSHSGIRPFRCHVCEQSFARNDVLTRHLKVHSKAANARASPRRRSRTFTDHGQVTQMQTSLPSVSSMESPRIASELDASDSNLTNGATHPSIQPNHELLLQPDVGTYLAWPDSENFLQNLMSWDFTNWDTGSWDANGSGLQSALHESYHQVAHGNESQTSQDASISQEMSTARTGHRALQAVNGLVRHTLSTVITAAELAELTPRFLDSSLHMFFTKFVPMLPIVHRWTFTFDAFPPFLLNAFAHGSLYLGSESAINKGEALWELAHTALATSWPSFIGMKGEFDTCCGVQLVLSAVLSQTYAAFSRKLTLRKTSQTFKGLSMHWAQYCGVHSVEPCPEPPSQADPPAVQLRIWRTWAARETKLRAILGVCIIDGVASQFSGNASTTWLTCNALPLPAEEQAFSASNPAAWIKAMEQSQWRLRSSTRFCDLCHSLLSDEDDGVMQSSRLALFDIRILLEILNSMAMESRRTFPVALGTSTTTSIAKALFRLRDHILDTFELTASDRSIAMLRWHAVCLDMSGSTSRGARRMCYGHGLTQNIFGGEVREEYDIDPTRWLSGLRAKSSLLHALEIKKIAAQLPIGATHDVYLAGAIFSAATTYASFTLYGISKLVVPCSIDWAKVLYEHGDDHLSHLTPNDTSLFLDGQLNHVNDNTELRHLVYDLLSLKVLIRGVASPWGVMQEMETVIGDWVARCE